MAPYKPKTETHYTGAPSLVEMAQRACIRNISRVEDVGDIPWKLVGPILKKIDNPEQLQQIEESSPHIANHTSELWKAFIREEIPQWQEKIIEPKNPQSWGKVYRKLKREEQRRLEASEEELRARMAGINKKREENKASFIGKVIAEPRRQQAFVDGLPNSRVRCLGDSVYEKKTSLKNAKTGKDFFNALRRPASGAARQQKPGVIAPTLPSARSQIPRAPESMLQEHKKPAIRQSVTSRESSNGTETSNQRIIVSRRPSSAHEGSGMNGNRAAEQAKREERLRALASGASTSTVQSPPLTPARSATATSAPSAPKESQFPLEDTSPVHSKEPRSALKSAADLMRRPSPSPTPPLVRKRPATPVSVFMPTKKRKV